MSERTERMIHSVTPWERDDPSVQAVMMAAGTEYDLIEELMTTVRDHAWPHRADDTYGLLSVHEAAMKLPVAPEGLTVSQRQTVLKTAFERRRDGRKGTWAQRLSDLVGEGQWVAYENTPGPNQITVVLSVDPASGLAAQVQSLVERFTPAHVEVFANYEGFYLGISPLGDTNL
jgi:hypothetical protein